MNVEYPDLRSEAPPVPAGPIRSLKVNYDRVGRAHVRAHADTASRAARFANFRRFFLSRASLEAPELAFAASLVVVEGIVRRTALEKALDAAPHAYRYGPYVCLEWEHEAGLDRRFLSPLSTCLLRTVDFRVLQTKTLLGALGAAMVAEPDFDGLGATEALDVWLDDAAAWLFSQLPGSLLAHCILEKPLAALPRTCLARQTTGHALRRQPANANEASEAGMGDLASRIYEGAGGDTDQALLMEIVAATRTGKHMSAAAAREQIRARLLALVPAALDSGALGCLMLAWILDLLDYVTPRGTPFAVRTIELYTSASTVQLSRALQGRDILDMAADDFEEIYKPIIDERAAQDRSLRGSLASFHRFLVEWFDAPQLRVAGLFGDEVVRPKANIVWPHESARIRSWLDDASEEDRLQQQVKAAFYIFDVTTLRTGELFKLRLNNAYQLDDTLELEVKPRIRDGATKSPSAVRRLVIKDAAAKSVILAWHARREEEGALSTDLLFGDPLDASSVYCRRRTYLMLRQLIKAATGDGSLGPHAYRHAWASRLFAEAMREASPREINFNDQLAVDMGHASAQTTLSHYVHMFEEALAQRLGRRPHEMRLTSLRASQISGVGAPTLRKRASRSSDRAENTYWDAIEQVAREAPFPEAAADIEIDPSPSCPLRISEPSLSFRKIFDIMSDMAHQYKNVAIAMRNSVRLGQVDEISRSVAKVAFRLGKRKNMVKLNDAQLGTWILGNRHENCFPFPINFVACRQGKFARVQEYLCKSAPDQNVGSVWERSLSGPYLSMERPGDARVLVRFLREVGIPVSQLVVRLTERTSATSGTETMSHGEIHALFVEIYGQAPQFEKVPKKRGRPDSYLLISGRELRAEVMAGPALALSGFHTLMLVNRVFVEMEQA